MNTTEVTELQKYIHILKDKQGCSDDYDEKMKDYALKNINNLCESPEYAKGIVKSYPAAQDAFLEYDGFSVLMRTLQSEVEKLQIKTARMLNKIILSRKEFQDNLYKLGYVHQLLELLQTTHNASHKHFLVMLNNLVTDHDGCLEICRNPSVALEGTLNLKIDSIEGIPHFSEELKYAKKLLITCFPHRLHDMDKTCT
uniref:Hsp70-binding protein 1-like n=1 Tax=Saccoglossus kowalevskii TaxID=10224 RepID=A0ABM0MGN8_SACKO|nr:PREDICTED: hsp70-binding protein 1-like [Saccoglossus kowalevskii]